MKSNRYGSRVTCWARSESPGGRVSAKLVTAFPARWWKRLAMWRASTSRLHPYWAAWPAYHNRRSAGDSFSRSATWWYHGNCARRSCTIAGSGQAAAKALKYFRFRGE